jgi:predicted nucleic acid-binding protein
MIVLDTNVISELWQVKPSAQVMAWIRLQPTTALFATTITEAEIFYGIALLPNGRRRRSLESIAEQVFAEKLAGRVLPFDSTAAREYAAIAASRRHAGLPISAADAQIAAITRSRGAALATRNVGDFADCGIALQNPWAP